MLFTILLTLSMILEHVVYKMCKLVYLKACEFWTKITVVYYFTHFEYDCVQVIYRMFWNVYWKACEFWILFTTLLTLCMIVQQVVYSFTHFGYDCVSADSSLFWCQNKFVYRTCLLTLGMFQRVATFTVATHLINYRIYSWHAKMWRHGVNGAYNASNIYYCWSCLLGSQSTSWYNFGVWVW